MKKILAMGIALLSLVLFAGCGNNEDSPSGHAQGTYMTECTINMRVPPVFPFTPVTSQAKVTLKAENENFVNVTLPGVTYNFQGQTMELPTLVLRNIPVLDNGNGGAKIPHHDFDQKVNKKSVMGVIKGEVKADGKLELDVEFKYGAMPYPIIQTYKSL